MGESKSVNRSVLPYSRETNLTLNEMQCDSLITYFCAICSMQYVIFTRMYGIMEALDFVFYRNNHDTQMINSINPEYLRTSAIYQTKFRYQDHMPMSGSHTVFSPLCLYHLHTLKWLWAYRYIISRATYHFSFLLIFRNMFRPTSDVISFSLILPRNSFLFFYCFCVFVFLLFCVFLNFLPLKCRN